MQRLPKSADKDFHLYLLKFVNGQISPMTCIANARDQSHTELRYIPLYRDIWKAVQDAMELFDPLSGTEMQAQSANDCLKNIDILDDLWLSSQILAEAKQDFNQWVGAFDPSRSFFDDSTIQALMNYLPSPKLAQSKRVRRIFRLEALSRTSLADREMIDTQFKDATDGE